MSTKLDLSMPSHEHKHGGKPRPVLPRYVQALRNAKNNNYPVVIYLIVETTFAPDAVVFGYVMENDDKSVKLRLDDGTEMWIERSAIVCTEVRKNA